MKRDNRYTEALWMGILLAIVLAIVVSPAYADAKDDARLWQELCERNELTPGECPELKLSHKPLHGLLPSWLYCNPIKTRCTVLLWEDAPTDKSRALHRRMAEFLSRR